MGAAPRPGHPGSPRVNAPSPAGPSMVKLRVNEWRGSPGGCQPPPPGQGSPAPRRRRARKGLTPSGQVPAQMFLGCASGRGNGRAREASARLGLRGKQGKKREVLRSRPPEPARRWRQPWCGTGDPSVCVLGDSWQGQWCDSGCAPWVLMALESERSGGQPSRHLLSLQRDGTGKTTCVLSGV